MTLNLLHHVMHLGFYPNNSFLIENIFFVDSLKRNLLRINQLFDKGFNTIDTKNIITMLNIFYLCMMIIGYDIES